MISSPNRPPARLQALALERLAQLNLRAHQDGPPPFLDWLPALSPEYVPPRHLAPLVECLEAIQRGETVRVVCHTPPRGGKTESLLHAIPWWLKAHPDWRIAYTSYNANQARSKARKAMELGKRVGVYASGGVLEWRTSRDGGCIARGVGEGITGQGIDVAIVDDPVKDRVDAESATRRERAWDWFREALFTRGNPSVSQSRPRSIIVNMARWHPDDLAGRLIAMGWRYICLPALVGPEGQETSFWPEGWTVAQLRDIQTTLGPYSWASLYQGTPHPKGGSVFGEPSAWTELPKVFRVARGLDLAYTEKTRADFSVCVTSLVAPGRDAEGRPAECFWVVDVLRKQMKAPDFQSALRRHIASRWRRTPIWIYGASGPEAGAVDLLRHGETGLKQMVRIQAVADKFLRAQPYAAAWNAGRVFVPSDSDAFPWVDDFVAEHIAFSGAGDAHDDQVDAGAAMHDSVTKAIPDKDIPKLPKKPPPPPGLAGMAM